MKLSLLGEGFIHEQAMLKYFNGKMEFLWGPLRGYGLNWVVGLLNENSSTGTYLIYLIY